MNTSTAILGAAVIIGGSLLVGQLPERYQVAAGVGGDGNPVVWRANVRNGTVELCSFMKPGDPADPFANVFDKFDPDQQGVLRLRCLNEMKIPPRK